LRSQLPHSDDAPAKLPAKAIRIIRQSLLP
jgi:hypothetical protein